MLAPGHRLGRVHEARRNAAASGEEARALRSQALQQHRRSRRNIAAARRELRPRVLVVDDSNAFRQAAASLVSTAPGLHLVGVAGSGEEALELLPQLQPDLVLLDVHMPGLGGIETARAMKHESPSTVVVLVSVDPASVACDLRSLGVAALVPKPELRAAALAELWLQHASVG